MTEPTIRKRPSTTKAIQLDIPEPSTKEKQKWKALLDICTMEVLKQDRLCNIAKKRKVRITYAKGEKAVKGFPIGRKVVVTREYIVVEYTAEQLLLYMYKNRLCNYSPNDLYRGRQKFQLENTAIENSLDVDIIDGYLKRFLTN